MIKIVVADNHFKIGDTTPCTITEKQKEDINKYLYCVPITDLFYKSKIESYISSIIKNIEVRYE